MPNPVSLIKVPKKFQPRGYEIIFEDRDIIVGDKAPGFLTVSALWNKETTIHRALNQYVRKGQAKSNKRVFVVHRLDQATSGVLMFAKTPQAQIFLKDHWKETKKIYYAVVHGKMMQREGLITSHLVEDEDYMMHSVEDSSQGKLAQTAYKVVKESGKYTLLEIDLLTGRKNQIRVHLAQEGHPIVGDSKYGKHMKKYPKLALHSHLISFLHPFSKERMTFAVAVPDFFYALVPK
jgi:RluA family pseudouridine synthase